MISTMDNLRGGFLWPPHGTAPAVVIANKIQNLDPFEAVKTKGDGMSHIALFRETNPHQ